MNNDLQNFYKEIEDDYKTESNSWNLFSDFNNIPEEYKSYMRFEFYALNNFESD